MISRWTLLKKVDPATNPQRGDLNIPLHCHMHKRFPTADPTVVLVLLHFPGADLRDQVNALPGVVVLPHHSHRIGAIPAAIMTKLQSIAINPTALTTATNVLDIVLAITGASPSSFDPDC